MSKPSVSILPAEKDTASFPLATVKAAFCDPKKLRMTFEARSGMTDLGMQETDVVDLLQALKDEDLHKSMPSQKNVPAWQDVYKTSYKGKEVYVKFTDNAKGSDNLLVLSFKRK